MKHILIADDHFMVRRGLKETLEEELGRVTFGEAANGPQVLAKIDQAPWDLVLLDISMEGHSGLEVLEEIHRTHPALPVLILSMYPETEFAVRALKLGASGYLNKQSAPEELVTAVQKVLAGGRFISAALADQLAADLHPEAGGRGYESLSNRELQVLRRIAQGQSLKDIADALSISVKTVGTYHLRLLEKMGMKSDVELTRYALRNKLVE